METITYRAFAKGRFDQRLEFYDYCDLFELQVLNVPVRQKNGRYYRENIRERPLTFSGDDQHAVLLRSENSYTLMGTDHIVVPVMLTARRFFHVSQFDVEEWESESKESDDSAFVGPIPGVAVVREILENAAVDKWMHPVLSDRREPEDLDDYSAHNYTENFTLPEQACGFIDCPVCYDEVRELDRPMIVIVGLPLNHPERMQAVKTARLQNLKRMQKILKVLQVLNMTYETLDLTDPDTAN